MEMSCPTQNKNTERLQHATRCSILLVLVTFRLLCVPNLLIDPLHALVCTRSIQRILASVPWDCEDPHVWPAMGLFSIRPIAKRMLVSPIWLVVNERKLVLGHDIAQSVVKVWQGVRPLTMTVRHRFLVLLTSTIDIRVEKPVPCEDPNHATHGHGGHPPIIVGRRISKPRVQHILKVVIGDSWICLRLQHDIVSLANRECGERTNL